MTARELLQSQLDALNADLESNPAVIDPRIEKKKDLENDLDGAASWFDCDLDILKDFLSKYL